MHTHLWRYKSPGIDGLMVEMIDAADGSAINVLRQFCNTIWSTRVSGLRTGQHHSTYLKITIALISHASKVLLHIIHERLKYYIHLQISQ
ncbi:hypothetical protein LAZ67_4002956 [Cordylochernes scorpioides]|uniref:Uncharacterized protein n=1 Tax=Cordylochernes scorpioides TaxID=51811 RepID=A0ABY6KD92_9ARAC|nr:hypothetical protein LAZ67_4002956 [Cordylochernes scorpioides]